MSMPLVWTWTNMLTWSAVFRRYRHAETCSFRLGGWGWPREELAQGQVGRVAPSHELRPQEQRRERVLDQFARLFGEAWPVAALEPTLNVLFRIALPALKDVKVVVWAGELFAFVSGSKIQRVLLCRASCLAARGSFCQAIRVSAKDWKADPCTHHPAEPEDNLPRFWTCFRSFSDVSSRCSLQIPVVIFSSYLPKRSEKFGQERLGGHPRYGDPELQQPALNGKVFFAGTETARQHGGAICWLYYMVEKFVKYKTPPKPQLAIKYCK